MQKKLKRTIKNSNILPSQSRFQERGPAFPSPIYSSSSQRSFLLFKFERDFVMIRKNNRDCKETLKKYNFKKLRRKVGTSEQVGPIFIFDF